MRIVKDDLIYKIQKSGGVSYYWSSLYEHLNSLNITSLNCKKYDEYLTASYSLDESHIFHSSYYRISNNPHAINIITIHDLIYQKFYNSFFKKIKNLLRYSFQKKSSGLICISHNTKTDLLKYYPDLSNKKIEVIYNGFNTFDNCTSIKPKSFFSDKPFFLYVGSRAKYKNFEMAIKSVSLFKDYQLVVAGGSNLKSNEKKMIKDKLKNNYIHLPLISNEELLWLYQNASLLLYPSLYEGFGMPPLEALYQGTPVFVLDTSINREILNSYCELYSHNTDIDLKEFIRVLLRNKTILKQSLKDSFNWKKTAEKTKFFFEETYQKYQ